MADTQMSTTGTSTNISAASNHPPTCTPHIERSFHRVTPAPARLSSTG